jgi:diguanylate cyclase (GGDEF)-like protein
MAKILVVDDHTDILMLISLILKQHHYEVITAQDGIEAIEKATKEQPDLILLDVQLPKLNGYKVCEILKEKEETKAVPVIFISSAYRDLKDIVRGLEIGGTDYITKPFDNLELLARIKANLRIKMLYTELEEKNRQLKELNDTLEAKSKDLQKIATTDGLTGLFNHRYFYERLTQEFAKAVRYNLNLSCIIVDLDHFKKINDTYGHLQGDVILKNFSDILRTSIRQTDIAARYGGEEFSILLPHTDITGAFLEAERIRTYVSAKEFYYSDQLIRITVSLGIAYYPHEKVKGPADLVKNADIALYEAKRLGRNQTVIFTDNPGDA